MPYTNYGATTYPSPNNPPGQGISTSQDRGPGTPVVPGMGGDPGSVPGAQYGPAGYDYSMATQVAQLEGLGQLFGPQAALSNILGQSSIDSLGRQGLLDQASLQSQMDITQQNAMFQQAGLGLQRQSLGIQQGALARQMGLLPQQYGLQQQGFGLQEQQIGLGEQSAQRNAATQQRDLQSSLVASGNPYSIGGGWQRQDISANLANQMAGFGINRQQVGLERQGAALTFQEQQAQQQDAQKELGIQSQQLGLSGQEITARMNNALQQLGLQGKVSVEQILQATNQIKQGMISPFSGIAQAVMNITNLPLGSGQGG